ncbi:MAG: molybdenum cofactor guanylyltransferase [Proteobacteria bacterium]|nr:molybdenum cofactor guanylyltransferase [Pseudomonadota bacterium]
MKQYAAILLAGGLSTRMGSSKADLLIEGETQTQRILEILHPLVTHTVVMLAEGQSMPDINERFKKKVIIGRDSKRENGPLQGISDAYPLLPKSVEFVYLLTCDLPYLGKDWLLKLSRRLVGKADAVCAITDGYKNALVGCYKRKVLSTANYDLEAGRKNAMSMWKGFNITFFEPDKIKQLHYKDMNTPIEYKKAKDYFKKMNHHTSQNNDHRTYGNVI